MAQLPREVAHRFWRKVRRAHRAPGIPGKNFSVPCLIWQGAVDNTGYGVFRAFPGCMGNKSGLVRVHRLAYWMRYGPFPTALQIDHLCEVRLCVEPTHLQKIGISEHASKSNDQRWHRELTPEEEEEILEELRAI